MTKSKLTRQEHNAAAMLLGMWYDHHDHTYNTQPNMRDIITVYDADTMEPWEYTKYLLHNIIDTRITAVKLGEIGCADGPFVEEDDGFYAYVQEHLP